MTARVAFRRPMCYNKNIKNGRNDGDRMDGLEPKKLALLRVLQILWEHTNESHPLHLEQIAGRLESDYGIVIERKAVSRNITLLRDAGFEIETDKGGYYLARRIFEDAELRLLIDGVLASPHIAARHSKDLIDKICSLSSRDFPRHISNIHSVEEWNRTENNTVFYNIEMIDDAIEQGKMVQYDYNKYGADKKLHKSSTQTVSPYQLVLHNQRYYLMGYCPYWGHMVYHRMDRITNMHLTDKPAVPLRSVPGFEEGINYHELSTAMPYMYAEKPERVTFRAHKNLMDQVVDWFGKDVTVRCNGEEVEVSVMAAPTAMLYWALQYADGVEILKPATLRDRVRDTLQHACEVYGEDKP